MTTATRRRGPAQPPVDSPWMSAREAAAYLGMSVDAIYDACARRGLKHSKTGHSTMLFRKEWLDEWVEAHVRG